MMVPGLEDRLIDVALVDARIVEEDGELCAGVEEWKGEEVDEEHAEDVACDTARAGLLLLAAALAHELLFRLSDLDLVVL